MLKERQKLPNPQADTKLPLPDRVIYHIHFNRKYIQESDAAILKLPYFPVRVYTKYCLCTTEEAVQVSF